MRYDYETYKAQAAIYQQEGAESRLGEDYASNQRTKADQRPINLFRLIRTWFRRLLAGREPEEFTETQAGVTWQDTEKQLQQRTEAPATD